MDNPVLIKVSGHQLDDDVFLRDFAEFIRDYPAPMIIVHGGGAEITRMQQVMGITPHYVEGLRVTDAESLAMVEMVLCGVVNKRLVRYLVNAGIDAMGMSGVDRGMVRGRKLSNEMGFTGTVTTVRADLIKAWLQQGVTPVIAPVCIGENSNLNVNADTVAGAIAGAVDVAELIFLSNVEGVLIDGQLVSELTTTQARKLIVDGTVFGGMIPKVTNALNVLDSGVPQVKITNLTGLKTQGGTRFVNDVKSVVS